MGGTGSEVAASLVAGCRGVAPPDVADQMVRQIAEMGEHLAWRALRWTERNDGAPVCALSFSKPHVIFYRVEDVRVQVVSVLHQRRKT
jgi:plasmid stabilization system protein ParE